jgi:hypothetical protein
MGISGGIEWVIPVDCGTIELLKDQETEAAAGTNRLRRAKRDLDQLGPGATTNSA